MFSNSDLDKLEEKINSVERDFAKRISDTTIVGEEAITERLLQTLELSINGFELSYSVPLPSFGAGGSSISENTAKLQTARINAPRIVGRSTVAKGANSEESISGADAMIVLESAIPSIEAHKGFLFQAKKHSGNGSFRSIGTSEIREQCRKMLSLTSSSYAIVYHNGGFYCFDCKDMNDKNWSGFHRKNAIPLAKIIRLFMMCKVGDHQLNAIDKTSFANFLSSEKIDQGLVISTE
ncbi:hypothetical protein WH158_15085 [Gluconobacter cerinus]|uniref:hypothetical protein n=1 Tax=Gluconobacter cerinus TaxID=38307 RepID=UPI0030977624